MSENYLIPNRPVPLTVVAANPIIENLDYIQEALNTNKQLADQVNNKIDISQKGAVEGVASLDLNGKLVYEQLPDSARTRVFEVRTLTEQLSLEAFTGDICLRRDLEKTFVLQGDNPSEFSNWLEIASIDSGGEIGANPAYANKFTKDNWILDGNNYSITYEPNEHAQGTNQYLLVIVKEEFGNDVITNYNVEETGIVKIFTNIPFDGNIMISNLQGNCKNNMYIPYTVLSGATLDGQPHLLDYYLNTVTLNCSPAVVLIDGLNFIRTIENAEVTELPAVDGEYVLFIDSDKIDNNSLSGLTYRDINSYLGIVESLPNEAVNGSRCYVPYQGSYERVLDSWKHKAFVPIGKVVVKNTTIQTIITYPFNQNNVDINYKSHTFDNLYGKNIEGLNININNNYLTIEPGKCIIGENLVNVSQTIIKNCQDGWVEGNNNGCLNISDFAPNLSTIYEVIKDGVVYYTNVEGLADDIVLTDTAIYEDLELTVIVKLAEDNEFIYNGVTHEIASATEVWAPIYLIYNGVNVDVFISLAENFPIGYSAYRRIGYAFLTINEDIQIKKMLQVNDKFYFEKISTLLDDGISLDINLPMNTEYIVNITSEVDQNVNIFTNDILTYSFYGKNATITVPIINGSINVTKEDYPITVNILGMMDKRND